ncbi:MAG TPA: glycosyltransferase [Candidatus Dormibacteraeota bacterium]|nr:glycosyltransferase [Candidatus Dormibacteraeota bacterium]
MNIDPNHRQRASAVRAVVYTASERDYLWTGRTIRSLLALNTEPQCIGPVSPSALSALLGAGGPVLFLKAGCWLMRPQLFEWPAESSTGRGLCAIGVAAPPPSIPAPLAQTESLLEPLAPPALYLDDLAARHIATRQPSSLPEVHDIAVKDLRTVHYPLLDVYSDSCNRVIQAITGLQRGGAERLTLQLVSELPGLNVRARLVTLGRPSREAFLAPPQTVDLSNERERAQALVRVATRYGADLIHAHLLSAAEMRSLSQAGFPVLATIHNTTEGWPRGLDELHSNDSILLAACSQAVETQLLAAKLSVASRTVWNGIDRNEFWPTPGRLQSARRLRVEWNFAPEDLLLVALANPRPQKRLHLLPDVLSALRVRPGFNREVRLVIAGEASPSNADAQQFVSSLKQQFKRLGLEPNVKWAGPVTDVASLLAACDVLVSTSAHEGLSLAHMEALAMDCDVVATDVGGARELAADHPRMHLLPVNASAEQFAELIASIASPGARSAYAPPDRSSGLSPHWSSRHMARRYAALYPRAISAAKREKGEGLWLLTNNFSTGGAQSSARRLLLGLAAEGIKVRAAVIEEHTNHPTPGRRALTEAGICVQSFEGVSPGSEPDALEALLTALDRDKPQSVLFWNLRPNFKVLLADALLDVPVFDVSPGEMYFESLDAFFVKPRSGFPYRTPRDYGARLAGVIVKYAAEAGRAADALGAPVHIVPNGVPLGNEFPQPPDLREPLVFGTAARINPRKRIEDLFEGLRVANGSLPCWTLKIAGGVERGCEDYAQSLRHQADGLPIEWLGDVCDVTAFHRDLDVFLMVSEPAGCPNASLEAMASGLPIIATDAGGASEQILSGRTGRLVPPRDPAAFAGALVELATQPSLRQAMGAQARAFVEQRFSIQRMVADYRRICLPTAQR